MQDIDSVLDEYEKGFESGYKLGRGGETGKDYEAIGTKFILRVSDFVDNESDYEEMLDWAIKTLKDAKGNYYDDMMKEGL